jgi:hypothetical protein
VARGSILKRPSGNYAIRYFDQSGERHYETIGPNRRDAEHALTTRLHQLQTGTWALPGSAETGFVGFRFSISRGSSTLPSAVDGFVLGRRYAVE